MILKKETLEKYGYNPDDLAPTSTKPVEWQCDICQFRRTYTKAHCEKKHEIAMSHEDQLEKCQKCSHAHRKGKATTDVKKDSWLPLPPEVDINGTIERFGYDPTTLSPWSRKLVVVRCYQTGRICTPKRAALNKSKSVMQTGHFWSIGAWTAERRKGQKASEETKEKQKNSQKQRRKWEKENPEAKEKINSSSNPYFMPYKPKA